MEKTLKEVLDEDRDGILVLPDFQRPFVWSTAQQKSLIATFLVQIPINSMLLLEGKEGDFKEKQMCWQKNHLRMAEKEERHYLLDGQQRLSTLKNAFSDIPQDADDWMVELDSKLKLRWFLRLMPKDEEEDIFGLRTLHFPQGNAALNKLEPSVVEDRLESYPLYKKNAKEWYAPQISQKDFYKSAVDARALPLYKLYGDNNHVPNILTRIANSRMDEIQSEWESLGEEKELILQRLCASDEAAEKWKDETPSLEDDDWKNCAAALATEWAGAMRDYLSDVLKQPLTFIKLAKDEIGRAIVIFENLNNSGTSLSTYDLLVARAAKCQEYQDSLEQRIQTWIREFTGDVSQDGKFSASTIGILDEKSGRMTTVFQNWYIDVLSLIIQMPEMPEIKNDGIPDFTNQISACFRRKSILDLDSRAIHEKSECAIRSLLRAITFLNQRCGLLKIDFINYKLMILPIAYLMQDESVLKDDRKLARIEYWYWVSIFSGRYISNQNRRAAEDTARLYQYAGRLSDYNPFAEDANNVLAREQYSDFNILIRPKAINPAVRNGIYAYVLSKKPHDFDCDRTVVLSAERIANNAEIEVEIHGKKSKVPLALELHHIIPLGVNKVTMAAATSELRKKQTHPLNSPLNMTYISSLANKTIGSQPPQYYLKNLYAGSRIDHFIPEHLADCSKEEGQKKFLRDRYERILADLRKHLQKLCQ